MYPQTRDKQVQSPFHQDENFLSHLLEHVGVQQCVSRRTNPVLSACAAGVQCMATLLPGRKAINAFITSHFLLLLFFTAAKIMTGMLL